MHDGLYNLTSFLLYKYAFIIYAKFTNTHFPVDVAVLTCLVYYVLIQASSYQEGIRHVRHDTTLLRN